MVLASQYEEHDAQMPIHCNAHYEPTPERNPNKGLVMNHATLHGEAAPRNPNKGLVMNHATLHDEAAPRNPNKGLVMIHATVHDAQVPVHMTDDPEKDASNNAKECKHHNSEQCCFEK